ncbi:MAG: DNA repair protein [Leptospiraceae bacterium]|nr:DNA repair protein [Leptospiraceae bacterium]
MGLINAPVSSLSKQKGIGKAKIATLFALRELCHRVKLKNLFNSPVNDFGSLLELLHLKAIKEVRECFYLITLDSDRSLINFDLLARGSLEEVGVHSREIVKQVLDDTAKFAIIAHNHPRQSCDPSNSDYLLFYQLRNLLSQLEVTLLDQWVVGKEGVFSCSKEKLILKSEKFFLP